MAIWNLLLAVLQFFLSLLPFLRKSLRISVNVLMFNLIHGVGCLSLNKAKKRSATANGTPYASNTFINNSNVLYFTWLPFKLIIPMRNWGHFSCTFNRTQVRKLHSADIFFKKCFVLLFSLLKKSIKIKS